MSPSAPITTATSSQTSEATEPNRAVLWRGRPEVAGHLERTLRSWLGVPVGRDLPLPPLPERLARLLLRVEEYERLHRDQWGCWEHAFSENFRTGRLWVPELDLWLRERERELADATPAVPRWPEERRFAVCLTHDVDMVSRQQSPAQVVRGVRSGLNRVGAQAERRAVRWTRAARAVGRGLYFGLSRTPSTAETLERCVAVEQEADVPASYFFHVRPAGRISPYDCLYALEDRVMFRGARRLVREIVRELSDEGFDIGLHGSYHSACSAEVLAAERAALERATGRPVTSTRQHYLHWDVRLTPRAQDAAGLHTDSTLGFNRNVGFRAGTSLPFRLFDLATRIPTAVLEVPLIVQEGPLLAANGLELDRRQAADVLRLLLDRVAEVGGVATLLFHPHSLLNPDHLALYRWSIDYGRAQGAWFASLRDIGDWWRAREAQLGLA